MDKPFAQKGVTLIEVLVGFVIFTSTMVAVLDYVSSQIYHQQLSATKLEKVQLIYELSRYERTAVDQSRAKSAQSVASTMLISSSIADTANRRDVEINLHRYSFSVADEKNAQTWVVYRVD